MTTALSETVSPNRLAETANSLCALATRAFAGNDEQALRDFHFRLYDLHDHDDPATEVTRRYLAAQAYAVWERHIPRVTLPTALTEAELIERIQKGLSNSRSTHPTVRHLLDGSITREELRVFMKYQWFRTYKLYQDANDLSITLNGNVRDAAIIYSYLHDEAGEGNPEGAHAVLLQKLLAYLGVPCDFELKSTCFEEVVYLNNRRRSFRSPDVEWAYAIFYVTELVVSAVHENLMNMLERLGIPGEQREYYRVHVNLVPPRAKREWKMFWQRLQYKERQEIFLTSLQNHLHVEGQYFDTIWRDMQAVAHA